MRPARTCAFASGVLVAALWFALADASVGHAHMAKSTSSLYSLIVHSDLVVRARVQELDTFVAGEGASVLRRSVLRIEVLEVLKGPGVPGEVLPISQHGHGVAKYRSGEEALFFLRHLSKSRELYKLASTGELQWYSTQEHDDAYALSESRRATLQAARRYVSIATMPREQRGDALRKITVKLLGSRDPRLGTSALRDLVRAPDLPLSAEEDVHALRKVIHDPKTSIGLRVGLLVELDHRGLLNPDRDWLQLLRSEKGRDRIAAIRGSASHLSPAVNAELKGLLAGSDSVVASAAAVSLGAPGNTSAVEPLSKALASNDKRVSMAAIRGLGAIGNAEAHAALESAAISHSDSSVRRRARAELRILDSASSP